MGWVYDFFRDATHPRGLWRRSIETEPIDPDTNWETVFDIDAYAAQTGKDWVWRGPLDSPDGRRVLLLLSLGSSDQIQAREFDLQTLEFVSGGIKTPLARQFLAWAGDDEVFVSLVTGSSDQTTSGLPRTVRKLHRGETLENAAVVHSCEDNDLYTRGWSVVGKQALLHVFLIQHSMQKSTLTIEQNGERKTLNLPRKADKIVTDRQCDMAT